MIDKEITIMESNYGSVENYYSEYYSRMMGVSSSGIMAKLWKYPHRLMERSHLSNRDLTILEVGAGHLEHLPFVYPDWKHYLATDIDLPRLNSTSANYPNFSRKSANASDLPFAENEFDRVIATCLLAHVVALEKTLEEWRRVVRDCGKITIYLPCEPGVALRAFRKLISARKARKLGFAGFDLYIARDHINDFARMRTFIMHVFRDDQVKFKFRPFPKLFWFLNMFCIVEITVIKSSI